MQASRLARPLRVVVSTGDVSGEMHAAALVYALRAAAHSAGVQLEVVACGAEGGALSKAGASIIADTGGTRCAESNHSRRQRSGTHLKYSDGHSANLSLHDRADMCYVRPHVRFLRLTPPIFFPARDG